MESIPTPPAPAGVQPALAESAAGGNGGESAIFQNFLITPAGATSDVAEARGGAAVSDYKEKYKVYAGVFSTDTRTIKRWVKIGRDAQPDPDLPPLDDPPQMAVWWARRMRQCVPAKLLGFAVASPAAASAPDPSPSIGAPATMSHSTPGAIGMMASLERLRNAEERAGRAYAEELGKESPDVGQIEIKQRAWERLSEALRKAEKDAGKILIDSGEMMPTSEVRQVVQEIFGALFQTWRQFNRRVRPLLSGKTPGEQDGIWDAETDSQFQQFQNNSIFSG